MFYVNYRVSDEFFYVNYGVSGECFMLISE